MIAGGHIIPGRTMVMVRHPEIESRYESGQVLHFLARGYRAGVVTVYEGWNAAGQPIERDYQRSEIIDHYPVSALEGVRPVRRKERRAA